MSAGIHASVWAALALLPAASGLGWGATASGGGMGNWAAGFRSGEGTSGNNINPGISAPATAAPIFLSGRVELEDGTAPPPGVVIERVCNGQVHAEGYTDSQGNFAIQLFQPDSGVMQEADASEGIGPGIGIGGPWAGGPGGVSGAITQENALMGCELRATLGGYRSQSISLAGYHSMDSPDLGTILLHRNAENEEGSTISAVSLAAPKDARKAFDKGEEALRKGKPQDARRDFEKAVAAYPQYAAAWCELGKLQIAADPEGARKSFQSALDADPRFVTPYVELALLDAKASKWDSVADLTAKAVRLDEFDYPQAFYFNALANYCLKHLDAAEKSAREAARLDTRHLYPGDLHLLGLILAERGDLAGAADELRAFLKLAPNAADAADARSQLARIEKAGAEAKK